ncbi:MAG: sulfur carrier protein ThiS [Firmicutes bacterium]|nr:sulfur carrier protein ThiS [Bacillota bacterium]
MQIVLNGKAVSVQAGLDVAGLVFEKKMDPNLVLVEYNGQVIKKEDWPGVKLKEGDRLELFQLVGGG